MRLLLSTLAALGVVGLIVWIAHDRAALRPGCNAAWERHWSADSSTSLCLPPGFGRVSPSAWARPFRGEGDFTGRTVFSIEVRESRDTLKSARTIFGASFGPDCPANCLEMVRAEQGREQWAGFDADVVEGAEREGGVAGRDIPVLIAYWRRDPGAVARAIGHATTMAGLDTLRQVLRTVVFPAPPTR